MNVLILGRTETLYNTAIKLSEDNKIIGIITAKTSPEYSRNEDDFKTLSVKLNVPFLFKNKIDRESLEFIKKTKPDICVSMNWVSILKREVMDIIPYGVLNAHFADLPRFKGNAVVNWAILKGEKKIPLTIHKMNADELDSGDIIIQEFIDIKNDTTAGDVFKEAEMKVPELFKKALNLIVTGKDKKIKQKGKSFRCYPRVPADSRINWNDSAENINRLIRASSKPFSGAYTYIKDTENLIKKVYIWKSHLVKNSNNDLCMPGHIIKNDTESGESWVFTAKGILAITAISYDNGEIMQPGKIWKSIRTKFEFDIEDEVIEIKNQLIRLLNKLNA